MVRLNRGGRGRGRPFPRPPVMPRHMPIRPMSPLPPFARPPMMRGAPRGRLLRHSAPHQHIRPPPPLLGVPPHPPRLFRPPPPPPPPPPHHPLHSGRPMPLPPHPMRLPPGLPPPQPPPFPRLGLPLRGKFRGGFRGGRGVKRLGIANGRSKKIQKRKEKTEEMEVNKPWITEALKAEIHKKFELYKVAKEKKAEADWLAFKEQRILVGKMTSAAKLEYIGSHPEAGDFFCETCDRAFKTQEKLDVHVSEHEVCGRDGCTFFAHPKIIVKHIQTQHDSGLFNRIVFTQSPADIAKWIAERKSRFPTKDNVERKQAQRKEMMDRGERIHTDNRPFRNSWADRQQMRTNMINNQNDDRKKINEDRIKVKPKPLVPEDPDAKRGNLPRFVGTAAFKPVDEPIDVSDDSEEILVISDDEDVTEIKISKPVEKPVVSGVLASLIANYGSDMTDDDDDDDDVKIIESNIPTSLNKGEEPKASEIVSPPQTIEVANCNPTPEAGEEDSGPEECSVDREDKSGVPLVNAAREPKTITSAKSSETLPKNQPPNYYINRQYPMRPRRPTLLEKLLQNEIRHERNVILQCVRYVVTNNFLGMGPASQQSKK